MRRLWSDLGPIKNRAEVKWPHLSIENTNGLTSVLRIHMDWAKWCRSITLPSLLYRAASTELEEIFKERWEINLVFLIILLLTLIHVWCYHQLVILGVWLLKLVDYLKGVVCSPVVKVMAQTGDYLEKKEIVSKKNWRYLPSSVFMFVMIGIFMLGIWWILQKSYKSKGFNFRNDPGLDKVHVGEQKKGKVGHLDMFTNI